jgi:hypothetical protein
MSASDVKNLYMPAAEAADDEAAAVLTERLEALRASATASYAHWKRSNDELLKMVIEAYLWWREANQVEGYLEGQYRARGIKWKK